MMKFQEPGYTPANLSALLQSAGLTQQSAAQMLGVDPRTVRKWCAELETASHRDMPLWQWRKLLEQLEA